MHEELVNVVGTTLGYDDDGDLKAEIRTCCNQSGERRTIKSNDLTAVRRSQQLALATTDFALGVMRACGVSRWEDVAGTACVLVFDGPERGARLVSVGSTRYADIVFSIAAWRDRVIDPGHAWQRESGEVAVTVAEKVSCLALDALELVNKHELGGVVVVLDEISRIVKKLAVKR